MTVHADLVEPEAIHPAAYVAAADPGAVGAHKFWVDTSSGPPFNLYKRNAANAAWEAVGATGGYSDPLTTNGDIVIRSGGVTTRLPIGSASDVLTVSAGLPAWAAPSGGASAEKLITRNLQQMWSSFNTIGLLVFLGANVIISGTHTAVQQATTNQRTAWKRANLASAASAGSVIRIAGGVSLAADRVLRDTTNGGWFFHAIVGSPELATSGMHFGCGVYAQANPQLQGGSYTNMTDMVMFGFDTGDAPGNWFLWHNDAAGTMTKVDTGIARSASEMYQIELLAPPGSDVLVRFTRLSDGTQYSATISTNLPTAGTACNWGLWGGNGAVASAFTADVVHLGCDPIAQPGSTMP